MTDSDSLRGDLDRTHRLPTTTLAGYPARFTSLEAPASPLEALANEMNLGGGPACPMRAQHLLRAGMERAELARLRRDIVTLVRGAVAWRTWVASKDIHLHADSLTDAELRAAFDAGEDESLCLANDRVGELQRELGEQAEEIETLRDEIVTERKLARAAAEGHDRVRGILLEIAAVFGCVDDLDTLPALVKARGT